MTTTLLHLVCTHCDSVNRIPASKLGDDPRCGRCKSPLISAHPHELDDTTFLKFIQRTDLPVIVDFWAPWCGPCRMMAPQFVEAARQLAPHVVLAKLNTDEAQAMAGRYEIRGIPCLIAFRDGQEIARQTGVMNASQIVAWARGLV